MTTTGHIPPCAWARILMAMLGVLMALVVFVAARTYKVEETVTTNDRGLIELRSDVRYMKESLSRIESTVTSAASKRGP